MNELFTHVMDGRNSKVHHDVENVLGRPAKSFLEYVAKTVKDGTWSPATQDATETVAEVS